MNKPRRLIVTNTFIDDFRQFVQAYEDHPRYGELEHTVTFAQTPTIEFGDILYYFDQFHRFKLMNPGSSFNLNLSTRSFTRKMQKYIIAIWENQI